ncbi:transglutaminase N-terminal domain-containing protein [Puia sp. P3]|uniref:transglutaminase N-terminal domain-containing protein n=1 Tax=Puia sp. P3 TaxID=3423952 RepID=UPI003D67C731
MKYLISHQTTYTYHEPVSVCYNLLRLVPRNTHRQSCTSVAVEIHPEPDTFHEYEDFFGNKVIYFSIEKEHAKLSVRVSSEIEQRMEAAGDPSLEQDADIGGYLFETPMTAANDDIAAYARGSFLPGRPVLEAAGDLMHRIYTDFRFTPASLPSLRRWRWSCANARGMPGFCAPGDCLLPIGRSAGSVRQRLHRNAPAARGRKAHRR